MSYQEAMFI